MCDKFEQNSNNISRPLRPVSEMAVYKYHRIIYFLHPVRISGSRLWIKELCKYEKVTYVCIVIKTITTVNFIKLNI